MLGPFDRVLSKNHLVGAILGYLYIFWYPLAESVIFLTRLGSINESYASAKLFILQITFLATKSDSNCPY